MPILKLVAEIQTCFNNGLHDITKTTNIIAKILDQSKDG